jgi:hypothetical protein
VSTVSTLHRQSVQCTKSRPTTARRNERSLAVIESICDCWCGVGPQQQREWNRTILLLTAAIKRKHMQMRMQKPPRTVLPYGAFTSTTRYKAE